MEFLYIKSLHIIFVVTWFAGLFYIPRLFIYHIEANEKPEPDRSILSTQLKMMQRKLWYIITWPSGILAIGFGIWLIILRPFYLQEPWLHLKLSFVLGLIIYHFVCGRMFSQLQADVIKHSSLKLRLWNEVATIFLIAIVFIVVLKDTFSWIWGVAGIFIIAGLLTAIVLVYKKRRLRKKEEKL